MYKLLALDLDGTVLNSQNQISQPLLQCIEQLAEHITVMIVTGRHHTAAKPYYDQLNLKTPIICCNGTYIYDYQTYSVIDEHSISKDNARQFLSLCDQYSLTKIMYVTDSMLYEKFKPMAHMEMLHDWSLSFPENDRPSILKTNNFEKAVQDNQYLWKFVVKSDSENITEFASHPFIQREFVAEQSFTNRFDYARIGNSKGNRLTQYINSLDITPAQVVAIGDNHNDISMIEIAGMGVTLAHAEDVVKQSANVVINANNDDPDALATLIDSLFKHSLSDSKINS